MFYIFLNIDSFENQKKVGILNTVLIKINGGSKQKANLFY